MVVKTHPPSTASAVCSIVPPSTCKPLATRRFQCPSTSAPLLGILHNDYQTNSRSIGVHGLSSVRVPRKRVVVRAQDAYHCSDHAIDVAQLYDTDLEPYFGSSFWSSTSFPKRSVVPVPVEHGPKQYPSVCHPVPLASATTVPIAQFSPVTNGFVLGILLTCAFQWVVNWFKQQKWVMEIMELLDSRKESNSEATTSYDESTPRASVDFEDDSSETSGGNASDAAGMIFSEVGESVEWVNMCWRKVWRVYQRGLERWIINLLQSVLDGLVERDSLPSIVRRLKILELTLDHEAPYFSNMRRRNSRKDSDLTGVVDLRYTGGAKMLLLLELGNPEWNWRVKVPVLVSDLDLECHMWLKLRLAPMCPWVGTIALGFVGPPNVKVQISPYGTVRLMRVPIVQKLLRKLFTEDLPALMVLPQRLEINIPPSVTSVAEVAVGRDTIMRAVASAVLQADAMEQALLSALPLGPQTPAGGISLPESFVGELNVTLREARNLPVWGFPWQSNPYCRLTLGEQAMQSRREYDTSHPGTHGNPVWNQEFQFLVEDPKIQALEVVVRDSHITGKPIIGKVRVPLSDLGDDKFSCWLPVEPMNPGQTGAGGEVLLDISYKPFEEDGNDSGYREAENFAHNALPSPEPNPDDITDIKSAAKASSRAAVAASAGMTAIAMTTVAAARVAMRAARTAQQAAAAAAGAAGEAASALSKEAAAAAAALAPRTSASPAQLPPATKIAATSKTGRPRPPAPPPIVTVHEYPAEAGERVVASPSSSGLAASNGNGSNSYATRRAGNDEGGVVLGGNHMLEHVALVASEEAVADAVTTRGAVVAKASAGELVRSSTTIDAQEVAGTTTRHIVTREQLMNGSSPGATPIIHYGSDDYITSHAHTYPPSSSSSSSTGPDGNNSYYIHSDSISNGLGGSGGINNGSYNGNGNGVYRSSSGGMAAAGSEMDNGAGGSATTGPVSTIVDRKDVGGKVVTTVRATAEVEFQQVDELAPGIEPEARPWWNFWSRKSVDGPPHVDDVTVKFTAPPPPPPTPPPTPSTPPSKSATSSGRPWWHFWGGDSSKSPSSSTDDRSEGSPGPGSGASTPGPVEKVILPADLPIEEIAREVAKLREEAAEQEECDAYDDEGNCKASGGGRDRSWLLLLCFLVTVAIALLTAVMYRLEIMEHLGTLQSVPATLMLIQMLINLPQQL